MSNWYSPQYQEKELRKVPVLNNFGPCYWSIWMINNFVYLSNQKLGNLSKGIWPGPPTPKKMIKEPVFISNGCVNMEVLYWLRKKKMKARSNLNWSLQKGGRQELAHRNLNQWISVRLKRRLASTLSSLTNTMKL